MPKFYVSAHVSGTQCFEVEANKKEEAEEVFYTNLAYWSRFPIGSQLEYEVFEIQKKKEKQHKWQNLKLQ